MELFATSRQQNTCLCSVLSAVLSHAPERPEVHAENGGIRACGTLSTVSLVGRPTRVSTQADNKDVDAESLLELLPTQHSGNLGNKSSQG